MKETSLSEKIIEEGYYIRIEDVREAVVRLEEDFKEGEIYNTTNIKAKIKKRFGEKLT